MQMYRPIFQKPHPNASIVLRTGHDPAAITAALNEAVRPFDHRPYSVRTLDQMLGGPSVMRRLTTSLLAVFAGIALFLSGMGTYTITWHSVSRRTQEFGIRAALGATKADVLRSVLGRGLTPVVVGAGVGLAGSIAAARVLSSQLFQLSPWDPVTYGAVSLLLVGVALLACYLPARHATRIDPVVALRYE
jgi:putative ABC transport system permease protein